MTGRIAMSAPDIDEADEWAIRSALRSGVLGLGPRAEEFERLAAETAGVTHGVAVSSGTAGLHLLVRALDIGRDDDVLVPSFTFAASANALIYEGATPIFVDIEPETYSLNPSELRDRRTSKTKAVMAVDVFGHPADWDGITLASEDLTLIDDCCEAIGGAYRGKPMGSFGSAGCFAFYPNKQMTTGEGGMIVTDDGSLAALCRSLRNQGRGEMGTWLQHERLGFNYRMDELSAALGVSQIRRLDSFLGKRARVAQMYNERLIGFDWLRPPIVNPHVKMSWFVYVITLAAEIDRHGVVEMLASEGIPSRTYFPPLHLQPYIRERFGTREGMLPITEGIARRTLALPFHNRLTEGEVEHVVHALSRAVAS
jgi:perosamine synthetase